MDAGLYEYASARLISIMVVKKSESSRIHPISVAEMVSNPTSSKCFLRC